jgi:hypothetical protein
MYNTELPEGSLRPKASVFAAELSKEWKAMSKEQRDDYVKDSKENLTEAREMKKFATHNAPLNAFHDARASLESIELQVSRIVTALITHVLTNTHDSSELYTIEQASKPS